MIEMLIPRGIAPQLHRMRRPTRQGVGQRLDGTEGALAATMMDRACHVSAQGPRVPRQMRRAEQIGNVGDDPVVTGIDKQVVVERFDVVPDTGQHPVHGIHIGFELPGRPLLGVTDLIDLGQSVEQALARGAHDSHSRVSVSPVKASSR